MNTLNTRYILLLFMAFFALNATNTTAQKKGKKTKKVKAASSKTNSAAAITAQLTGMSREEKNTLSKCPLHKKHMSLSDNYRADASDHTVADASPFAYQLNYRRSCHVCTRTMSKEVQDYTNKVKEANNTGATFSRCEVHNQQLKGNPDFNGPASEKNPNIDEMPHARQYLFSNYCKVCTKLHKIETKAAGGK